MKSAEQVEIVTTELCCNRADCKQKKCKVNRLHIQRIHFFKRKEDTLHRALFSL